MASITEQLKKFAARITTAAHPTEVPGQSIDEVLSFISNNLNVNQNGEVITKNLNTNNYLVAITTDDLIAEGRYIKNQAEEIIGFNDGDKVEIIYSADKYVGKVVGKVYETNNVKVILSTTNTQPLSLIQDGDNSISYACYLNIAVGFDEDGKEVITEGSSSHMVIATGTYLDNFPTISIISLNKIPTKDFDELPVTITTADLMWKNQEGDQAGYAKNFDGTINKYSSNDIVKVTLNVNNEEISLIGKIIGVEMEGDLCLALMDETKTDSYGSPMPPTLLGDDTNGIHYSAYLNLGMGEGMIQIEGKYCHYIKADGTYVDNFPDITVVKWEKL